MTTAEIVERLREYADRYEGSALALNLHRAADRLEDLAESEALAWRTAEHYTLENLRLKEDTNNVDH